MALLKSVDNRFYEVPETLLEQWLLPKERVARAGVLAAGPAEADGLIETFTESALYDFSPDADDDAVLVASSVVPETEDEPGTISARRRRGGWRNWHNYWHNYY